MKTGWNKHIRRITISTLTVLFLFLQGCSLNREEPLPSPEKMSGYMGEMFDIDANVNYETIDQYLHRSDTVYFDMRMLDDPADYAAIGGSSALQSTIEGFEIVPYPYLCEVRDLPEEVGEGYQGRSLFSYDKENDACIANYEESYEIISGIFPHDKYIILMCGGGGYASQTKELLIKLGYDPKKIYNGGGIWYYQGEHLVTFEEKEGLYDYSAVTVHDIPFDSLKRITDDSFVIPVEDIRTEGKEVYVDVYSIDHIKALQEEGKSFLVYIYLPGCSSCAAFQPIVREYLEEKGIYAYRFNIDLSKQETLPNAISENIAYAPSVAVFIEGDLIAFLDPTSDEDTAYYLSLEGFESWIAQYIR